MKILMVLRLYSGFEKSLDSGEWHPEGLPSVYKWMSRLESSCDLRLVFTAKDSGTTYKSDWLHPDDKKIKIAEFRNEITVLSGVRFFRIKMPRKLGMILRELRQTVYVFWACVQTKPSVVYCDSANVLLGAVVARLLPKTPVVIRLLGVCTWWWSIIESRRWIDRLYLRTYQSTSFALVVGTQDGSGTEFWLDRVLSPTTPRVVLLNGVDSTVRNDVGIENFITPLRKKKGDGTKIILFVGRLETYKGVDLFLSEMIGLLGQTKFPVHIVMIGSGNMLDDSKRRVARAKKEHMFSILGSIPHKYINAFHDLADIYVSTNMDGSLTNANLEAIASDDCILIPSSLKNQYVDRQTKKLLGDSVCYYDIHGSNSLREKVMNLIERPDDIQMFRERLRSTKKAFLRTWEQRFDQELCMLKNIAGNNKSSVKLDS